MCPTRHTTHCTKAVALTVYYERLGLGVAILRTDDINNHALEYVHPDRTTARATVFTDVLNDRSEAIRFLFFAPGKERRQTK